MTRSAAFAREVSLRDVASVHRPVVDCEARFASLPGSDLALDVLLDGVRAQVAVARENLRETHRLVDRLLRFELQLEAKQRGVAVGDVVTVGSPPYAGRRGRVADFSRQFGFSLVCDVLDRDDEPTGRTTATDKWTREAGETGS